MNWVELAIGFAAGCGYNTTITFILAWLDRREGRRRRSAG